MCNATHKISAVFYPHDGILELTWEDIETGEKAALTTNVPAETGRQIAKVVPTCVYHKAITKYPKREEHIMQANMTLKDLIAWLEQQDPELIVSDGFGSPHSDRGSYDELAFKPKEKARIGDMLRYAKSALGAEFTGWEGGTYIRREYTSVYIGEWGDCGHEITPIHFKYWLLTAYKEKKS